MKLVPTVIAFFALGLSARAEEPFADLRFADALAQAERTGKIVMVDFFTTWCAPCKKLDQVTWKDAGVRAWLAERTVALKVDAEKEVELAKRYAVGAYPTIVFVEPSGDELDRLVGYQDPGQFLASAKDIAAGKNLVDVQRGELEANRDDPMWRAQFAQTCMQRGLHAEALEHFLWCWDHGLDHNPNYHGVRLSFLLSSIAQLGAAYPEALIALRERRDACEKALLGGQILLEVALQMAGDLAALNSTLTESEGTLRVHDALADVQGYAPETLDRIRQRLFQEVADLLLEERRYAEVLKGLDGDPESYAKRQIEMTLSTVEAMQESDNEAALSALPFFKARTVADTSRGYAALSGLGQHERAAALAGIILEFEPTLSTYKTLVRHAAEHGGSGAAAALDVLLARGKGALEEKDLASLEREVKRAQRKLEPGRDE